MSGPIVRTGATPEFWKNWDTIFGGKKTKAAATKPTKAVKAAPAKAAKTTKPAKKAVKKK